MTKSTNHHYVPRWYLKHFGTGKGFHLYVYDKHEDRIFRATPAAVASEIGFYDYPDSESGIRLEEAFNKIETPSAHIVRRLITEESTASLEESDRNTMALFIALQILRVKEHREEIQHLDKFIRESIVARGGDPDAVEGYSPLSSEELRLECIRHLRTAPALVPLNKAWFLLRAPAGTSYYASDNPVTRNNTINKDPLIGTLGLASAGIEVYLPLNHLLCLALYCPTIRQACPRDSPLGSAIRTGSCVTAMRDNITHANSLQVGNATRFLFSSKPQFDLAKAMIRDNPAFRIGRRPTVSYLLKTAAFPYDTKQRAGSPWRPRHGNEPSRKPLQRARRCVCLSSSARLFQPAPLLRRIRVLRRRFTNKWNGFERMTY